MSGNAPRGGDDLDRAHWEWVHRRALSEGWPASVKADVDRAGFDYVPGSVIYSLIMLTAKSLDSFVGRPGNESVALGMMPDSLKRLLVDLHHAGRPRSLTRDQERKLGLRFFSSGREADRLVRTLIASVVQHSALRDRFVDHLAVLDPQPE